MKKVLAICMALVLVVALPLAVSAAGRDVTISLSSEYWTGRGSYFTSASESWVQAESTRRDGNVLEAVAPSGEFYGYTYFMEHNGSDYFTLKSYEYIDITLTLDMHYTSDPGFRSSSYILLFNVGTSNVVKVPMTDYSLDLSTMSVKMRFLGHYVGDTDYSWKFLRLYLRQDVPLTNMLMVMGDLRLSTGIEDKDAYNTAQIIDQIQTSTDEITGSIDDSTDQIVGELDEIQSDIKGDDWTSPAPGKDDELNGAMSDYDDAYNEAVGGKSDQEIVDEVSGQVDYDYGALDQQSVSGVTGFLSDLLDSFGADYKSLLMLSLTIGLAVYVIGRRVSSA